MGSEYKYGVVSGSSGLLPCEPSKPGSWDAPSLPPAPWTWRHGERPRLGLAHFGVFHDQGTLRRSRLVELKESVGGAAVWDTVLGVALGTKQTVVGSKK